MSNKNTASEAVRTVNSEQKALGEESLAPQNERIMDPWSYLFAWLGGCVSIGTFTVGSGLVVRLGVQGFEGHGV